MIVDVINKRNNKMLESKNEVYNDFWLRVLTNHKVINSMINDSDRESLKFLKNISYVKLDDGNVCFSFISFLTCYFLLYNLI